MKIKIKKIMIPSLFLFSFLNEVTLLIVMLLLLGVYIKEKEIGLMKYMIILTLRQIISPGLAVGYGTLTNFKLGIFLLVSIYLIKKLYRRKTVKKHGKVFYSIYLFGIYIISISFYNSSYPLLSVLKVINFLFPMVATLMVIASTSKRYDWNDYLYKKLTWILYLSLPTIKLAIGYLRNGRGLQGITNHPNLFGPLLCIYISTILIKMLKNKDKVYILNIILALICIYLTQSRTSLGTGLVIILIYILNIQKLKLKNIIIMLFGGLSLSIMLLRTSFIEEFFFKFFTKGNSENILYSRMRQYQRLIDRIDKNFFFGSGFMTPVSHGKDWGLRNHIVEAGNILLAMPSFVGISGSMLFILVIYYIVISNKGRKNDKLPLIVVVFMINLGEMLFFSINNYAIILYVLLGIYITSNNDKEKNVYKRRVIVQV